LVRECRLREAASESVFPSASMTSGATSVGVNGPLPALSSERLHSILRRMADDDWLNLKGLLRQSLALSLTDSDVELLERLFRRGEAIARDVGGAVCRIIQSVAGDSRLMEEAKRADERVKARARFVLREMGECDWAAFKELMVRKLTHATQADDVDTLELVFRLGESVTNIEVAALALAEKQSGRRLLNPEVARTNAAIKSAVRGTVGLDPEVAYLEAKRALEESEQMARRAEHTLAYYFARPTASFRHARNTVFRMVETILECPELLAELLRLEREFAAVPSVCRERMRWAMHRMPMRDRLAVLKLIPLNTILMFQQSEARDSQRQLLFNATRDRRLAFDLFVRGYSDEELAATFRTSLNAVKNAVGNILQTLIDRPLARKPVAAYLQSCDRIPPMDVAELRRLIKGATSRRRSELVAALPNCVWKVRAVMPLHKHLFLDYMSGEWVLGALVHYYNVHKTKTVGGLSFAGTLTVRGANAAIEGILHKLTEEPDLRQLLRERASSPGAGTPESAEENAANFDVDDLLPALPSA
jgi:hypothetical protein